MSRTRTALPLPTSYVTYQNSTPTSDTICHVPEQHSHFWHHMSRTRTALPLPTPYVTYQNSTPTSDTIRHVPEQHSHFRHHMSRTRTALPLPTPYVTYQAGLREFVDSDWYWIYSLRILVMTDHSNREHLSTDSSLNPLLWSSSLLCKIWGFHGGDYEEWCLLGCYAVWLL
jgi:hypothetical protein